MASIAGSYAGGTGVRTSRGGRSTPGGARCAPSPRATGLQENEVAALGARQVAVEDASALLDPGLRAFLSRDEEDARLGRPHRLQLLDRVEAARAVPRRPGLHDLRLLPGDVDLDAPVVEA